MTGPLASPLLDGGSHPPPQSVSGRQRVIWDVTDSINFIPATNGVALTRNARLRGMPFLRKRILGITGRTFMALATTLVTGILIGITAKLMEQGIVLAVGWRNAFLAPWLLIDPLAAVGRYLAVASASVLLTAAVVQWIAPGAAGSGVSLVIALLNGNNIAGLLTPAVYFVKLLGTCVSRMAGLALGPEAPMVHLGACVASLVFAVQRRIWGGARRFGSRYENWKHDLDPAFSNMSHREIVSAGAAGGMAAAFGAPVGGVLFALEEACSVWSRKTAWRCLLCTATAVFTMSQLLANSSGGGILSLRGIYPLSSRQWLMQLPFVTAVSAGAGLLGAAFNLMRSGMQRLRAARKKHALRLLEAAVVAAITVLTIASSSHYIGRCLDLPESWKSHQVVQWTCPVGQYNDLATGLLGETPFVVRSLLGLGSESEPMNGIDNRLCNLRSPCYYSAQSLAILSFVYLGLMVLSSGLAVPGGLFMPSVIIGGSFGALSGMLLNAVLPPAWDVQPGVYAMVGATATMAAVFRSSISLVVIIVEGTRGIEFLPGILAATIISNFIAHWLHPDGVYESELERDGRVFFLRQEPPGALRWRTAENIMASPVMGLRRVEEVSRVVQVLKSTLHNGFPVYPSAALPGSSPDEQLEGFILRTQLLVLLQERAFCDAQGQYLVPPGNFEEYEAYLDGLMHAAESSCDGLGGAAEMALAVDPLGQTDSGELGEQEVNAAMIPTLETLETLRTLPSLVACLADDTIDRALQSVVDGNTIQGLLTPPAAPNSGNVTPRSRLSGASPRSAAPILYVNLSPFMDRGMVTVRTNTPATSLHKMFVALSLRHLCVVNEAGKMVGIITRKDLDNAAGHGPLRSNKMAPGPTRELSGPVPPRSSSWLSSSLHALLNRITPSPPSSVMGGESPLPHGGAVLGDGSESVGGDVARGQRQPSLSPFDRYESLF